MSEEKPLEKKDWELLFERLKLLFDEFSNGYYDSRYGRTQKIRKDGQKKAANYISIFKIWIEKYSELYVLLTGHGDNYSRAIMYDELNNPQYFNDDIPEFFEKIKNKIASFDTPPGN